MIGKTLKSLLSLILALTMLMGVLPIGPSNQAQAQTGTRSLDTEIKFEIDGIKDISDVLRYAGTQFSSINTAKNEITLNANSWTRLNETWPTNSAKPYASNYVLWFQESNFYTNIDSIKVDGVSMVKEEEGAVWRVPIDDALPEGLIGSPQSVKVVIKLKSGLTLDTLGLSNENVTFSSAWITEDNKKAQQSMSNGYILAQNPILNTPMFPAGGDWGALGVGDGNFTTNGFVSRAFIDLDSSGNMVLKTVHTFTPPPKLFTI